MGVSSEREPNDTMLSNMRLQTKLMALVLGPLAGLLVFGSVSVVGASRTANDLEKFETDSGRLYQAAWETKYFDEVLTHSAARYITSKGDPIWWKRYEDNVVRLDAALAVGKQYSTTQDQAYLDEVAGANKKLIDMETAIHDLVEDGKYDDANNILSGEYDTQKLVYNAGLEKFFDATTQRVTGIIEANRDRANTQRSILLITGALISALMVAAFVLARRLTRPIVEITAAANKATNETIPQMLAAVQTGTDVPVSLETFDTGTADELGDLTRALDSFQAVALNLAKEQTLVRRNMAETLVNLGRRNQGLLNKTLKLITNLEREERDPQRLDQLFKLDHLATRVRRNAESLLVLAGSNSSRVSPRPVEITDVLRAAVSEIEDYARIDIDIEDRIAIRGSVVADIAHLIAELLENAASCSPPNQRVHVTGRLGTNEFRVVVADEGLGMSAEALADANERVSTAPKFDAKPTKALGLHVVGRLAERHGITVRLMENVTGGIAAKISIPLSLTMDAAEPTPAPAPVEAATADVLPIRQTRRSEDAEAALPASESGADIEESLEESPAEVAAVDALPARRQQRQRGANRFESGRPVPTSTKPSVSPDEVANRFGSFQSANKNKQSELTDSPNGKD